MKVALVAEGTYPVHAGGVSTWCHQLVLGMPEHEWTVVGLTATSADRPTWPRPSSVRRVVLHPLWDPPPRRRRGRHHAETTSRLRGALRQLWDAALAPDGEAAVQQAEVALRRLTALRDRGSLSALLGHEPSSRVLLATWRHRCRHLPPLSVADAVAASHLVDRMLSAADADLGQVDLVHAAGNGAAAVVALTQLWRNGTPFVLSEHGIYLRERYLGLNDGRSWHERRVVTALTRRICEVAYRRALRVLPVSDFNRRWVERLGAPADRVVTIRNGVQPDLFEPAGPEPEVPTLSWVGRIDPLKDLHTLVRAFALVRERIPEARLRMFGPVPDGNEAYRNDIAALIAELGLDDVATFEGPAPSSRPAIAAGSVVVLSSISEGLPFTLIEAMMCGRATVSTDVGGVAECVDPARTAGAIVPARDPEALADACVELLEDPVGRAAMAEAARRHALRTATLDRALDEYRSMYGLADSRELAPAGTWDTAPNSVAVHAVPSPRGELVPAAEIPVPVRAPVPVSVSRRRDDVLTGGRP